MALERVRVKEETEWSGVNTAAMRAGLYAEHEVKHELVLGPERVQPQDITYALAVRPIKDEEDFVKQEPVQSTGEVKGIGGSARPVETFHLNKCLEQLVHRTCFIRLERTPLNNTLHRTFNQRSTLMSHKHKHKDEIGVTRKLSKKTQVHNHTKRYSYICDYCGKQFVRKPYLIKHVRIHIEQISGISNRIGRKRLKVKHKLKKQQCSLSGSAVSGVVSAEGSGLKQQVTLRTCFIRLERIRINEDIHMTQNQTDSSYVSNESAFDTYLLKKPYCAICDKNFSTFNYLKKHVVEHLWEKQFTCETCKKKFCDKFRLILHIKQVHGDRQKNKSEKHYSCDICQKSFSTKARLSKHERIHSGEKPFACDICMKRFIAKDGLIRHIRIHTGEKPYSCEVCLKRFAESSQLVKHRRIHTGKLSNELSCKICQRKLRNNAEFNKHMLIHTREKRFICEICGKAFRQRGTLLNHSRTHGFNKPFSCDICKRQFQLQKTLYRHKQNCSQDKVTCDICKKRVRSQDHLRTHMRVHTGEKPHKCDVCQKPFASSYAMILHKEAHIQRPFTCEICNRQFRRREGLLGHMRVHTREKLYACDVCQRAFAFSRAMIKHKRTHLEKPFTCEICKKQFRTMQKIVCHMQTHTNEGSVPVKRPKSVETQII